MYNITEKKEKSAMEKMSDELYQKTLEKQKNEENKFKNMNLNFKAMWISPSGEIIGVDNRHINYISDHPEKFGLTKNQITSMYEKYNERLGQEGKAREEIMLDLMIKGWIRARYTDNKGWLLQTYKLTNKLQSNIEYFVKALSLSNQNGGRGNKYEVVTITEGSTPSDFKVHKMSIADILDIKLHKLTETKRVKGTIKLKNLIHKKDVDKKINEISLTRIITYTSNKDYAFGIVSAYRQEYSIFDNFRTTIQHPFLPKNSGKIYSNIDGMTDPLGTAIFRDIIKKNNLSESDYLIPGTVLLTDNIMDKINLAKHKKLIERVRDMGYGYVQLDGGWVEKGVLSLEKSLFIPYITKAELYELGFEFTQQNIIYKDENEFTLYNSENRSKYGNVDAAYKRRTDLIDANYKKISDDKYKANIDKETGKPKIDKVFSKLKKGPDSYQAFQFNYK